MTDSTKETEQGNENQKTDSDSKKKRRFLRGCLWFCLVVAFLLVASGFYLYSKITEPIDVKKASTVQAVGWLTMRDLSQESPETRGELFQLYAGDGSIPDVESDKPLELSDGVKKMAGAFMQGRQKRLEAWSQQRSRAPYLRLDYLVVPRQIGGRSQYVVSDDVQPGPSLKARWTRSRETRQSKGASQTSLVERNVRLLVMQWFIARRDAYDSTPDKQKRQKLETTADELLRMQSFYNSIKGKREDLTRVQMLREFEATMESWNEFASVEELAKTLWFKDLLISVVASKNVDLGKNAALYPPLLPEKYRATSEKQENARFEIAEKTKPICDAVRNYFFDAAN